MRTFLKLSLVLFFVTSFNSCVLLTVEKDMVHLDQAFIPVYYHAWKGDMISAKESLFSLEFEWQQFQNRYQGILPEDEDWQEAFRRTEFWLGDAYCSIDANLGDYAMTQLDHARYEMMEMRRRKGIDYYLDYLYNFQMNMMVVHETAVDDMLCLMEWSEFELITQKLNSEWDVILELPFDNELYEFDKFKTHRLSTYQRMISFEMDDVIDALHCGDHFLVGEKIEIVETTFMKMLSAFGRFPEEENIAQEI